MSAAVKFIKWRKLMFDFKRLWSAIEWGLLYGFITWILGTGFSNRIPGWGVWFIIFDRVFLSVLLYYTVQWRYPRWLKGTIAGIVLSIPLAFVAVHWPFFNLVIGHVGAIGTGIVSGILMAYSIHSNENEKEESQAAKS